MEYSAGSESHLWYPSNYIPRPCADYVKNFVFSHAMGVPQWVLFQENRYVRLPETRRAELGLSQWLNPGRGAGDTGVISVPGKLFGL